MNSNTSYYKEYTFQELLKQYDKILIPMIQRDYAQGRTNKKETDVRNNLLNDIFSGKKVHFDLVFGSVESRIVDGDDKRCFIPVDGQQRLTTLFLLYLYGKRQQSLYQELDLSKFTYDTRRAAADFCKFITKEKWLYNNKGKVSDAIKDCSWFMDYWAQDPTVEGMLNMLDAIHEKYKQGNTFPDLENVTFYFFDLESNGLNENLYLKMNSRGKPLTAFENLKAKIEKVLPDNIEIDEKFFPECDAAPKDSFKEKWKFFMDRNWTETFWDSENPSKYDVNIAKFIVRFLAGYWAAFGKVAAEETTEETTTKELVDANRKEQNDKNYADYIKFEPIEKVLKLENAFSSLAYALTTVINIAPYWTNDTIKVSDKSEYKLLAVIFTNVLFDRDNEATRFAWNMAENYVTEYDTFVTYCKRIGKFYKVKCNKNITFYQALSDIEFDNNTSDQLKEEITKAKQILKGIPREDGKLWEDVIIEAEKYAFFKGAIRFLFTKNNIGDDWNAFDKKWKNATDYFDSNGVQDGKEPNKKYRTNSLLMKSLLAKCDDFWKKIYGHFEFSNDAIRWKRILTSNNWRTAVDAIMGTEITDDVTSKFIAEINEPYIKNIVDDGLMNYVCNEMSGAWIRNIPYYNYQAIWINGRPNSRVDLNPILSKLKFDGSISYRNDNGRDSNISHCRYYKCCYKNVDFEYKGYYFNWKGNPNNKELDVYLTEVNWNDYKKRPNPTIVKNTEEDTHYCFKVTNKEMEGDTSLFTQALDNLISEYKLDIK